MALTKTEFRQQYSYMFPTSTKLSDAYRQYQLSGTLPGTTTTPTTTTTTPTITDPTGGYSAVPTTPITVAPTTPTTPTTPTVPPIEVPTITTPPPPTPPVLPTVPTLEPPTMPEVAEVPPYEKSPEQIAWEEEYGTELKEWREAGGYGIPEDIQTKMIQKSTDILKARETENIRIMRNNMERRGITNSGFVFANEQTIRSNTTVAIANNIRDVQISSALMKMASFEKSMGATAQFIGYLADESLKAYAPKMAQWEMEAKYDLTKYGVKAQYGLSQAELEARYGLTEHGVKAEYGMAGYQVKAQASLAQFQVNAQAGMTKWQTQMDLYKMEINQAYTQQNTQLLADLQAQMQDDQQAHELQLIEMELEASQQASLWEGIGSIATMLLGFLFL